MCEPTMNGCDLSWLTANSRSCLCLYRWSFSFFSWSLTAWKRQFPSVGTFSLSFSPAFSIFCWSWDFGIDRGWHRLLSTWITSLLRRIAPYCMGYIHVSSCINVYIIIIYYSTLTFDKWCAWMMRRRSGFFTSIEGMEVMLSLINLKFIFI